MNACRWKVVPTPDRSQVQLLSSALNVPPTLAALLVQRGYVTPDEAKSFLRPALDKMTDPFLLKDMDKAVAIVGKAVRSGTPILVHGDYDVDGQCSAALLTRVLELAGATVVPFVPHRLRDGYDFGPAGLKVAAERGASLVLTCDCGVSAVEAVQRAKEMGLEVVVTDHHLTRELPPADAIINPRREDCDSPSKELCGAGVAFKLVQALCGELGLPDSVPFHFLDLVALATVADIVPLVGENRTLVRFGLKMMEQSRWAGVRALLEVTGLSGKPVRAGQVGYVLAPRLNAAGRIGESMEGLKLLLTDDQRTAFDLAVSLDTINARRQEIDERILAEAIDEIDRSVDLSQYHGLVLARDGWHPGVIGIVASRVVERYHRPTILIGLDGEEGKGSGRSIPAFDLHEALGHCSDLLVRWGGHKAAAGLTVRRDLVEPFREAFNQVAVSRLSPDELVPTQRVDIVGSVGSLSDELERLMRHLEPCGPGNPAPVLGVRRAHARKPTTVGANHVKFTLEDGTGTIPAIGFGWADRLDDGWWRDEVDVALQLGRNEWRGTSTLQARVVQIKSAD
ncbi:MAG: single-stranded-DNA-specific exonuclease RecJ [Gemmatimonadota bacterium]|nr:MAG: single-stranded-DNA-specific exonuclease RecJ [Gemmatimonadota bacterium]